MSPVHQKLPNTHLQHKMMASTLLCLEHVSDMAHPNWNPDLPPKLFYPIFLICLIAAPFSLVQAKKLIVTLSLLFWQRFPVHLGHSVDNTFKIYFYHLHCSHPGPSHIPLLEYCKNLTGFPTFTFVASLQIRSQHISQYDPLKMQSDYVTFLVESLWLLLWYSEQKPETLRNFIKPYGFWSQYFSLSHFLLFFSSLLCSSHTSHLPWIYHMCSNLRPNGTSCFLYLEVSSFRTYTRLTPFHLSGLCSNNTFKALDMITTSISQHPSSQSMFFQCNIINF